MISATYVLLTNLKHLPSLFFRLYILAKLFLELSVSRRVFQVLSTGFSSSLFFLWCFQLLSRRFYFVFQSLNRNFLVCQLNGGSAPLSVSAKQFLPLLLPFFHFSVIVFNLALLFVVRIYRPSYLSLLCENSHRTVKFEAVNECWTLRLVERPKL